MIAKKVIGREYRRRIGGKGLIQSLREKNDDWPVVGLTETFLTITLYSNGRGLLFCKIQHCNLNPLSANFTFFSINEIPFISILVLNSRRKISEHKVALQYAIGIFPPLGWILYHHLSYTVSGEIWFSPDASLRLISCPIRKDRPEGTIYTGFTLRFYPRSNPSMARIASELQN